MVLKDSVKRVDHSIVNIIRGDSIKSLHFGKNQFFAVVQFSSEIYYDPIITDPIFYADLDDAITKVFELKKEGIDKLHHQGKLANFPLPSIVQRNGRLLDGEWIERMVC